MRLASFVIAASLIMALIFAVTVYFSPSAMGLTLTVTSMFTNQTAANVTSFSGTTYTLVGTPKQISDQYYKLGEEFDKKAGTKPGEPMVFVFKNGTRVTVPYSGEYKNPVSEAFLQSVLLDNALTIGGDEGGNICWINNEYTQSHWICMGHGTGGLGRP